MRERRAFKRVAYQEPIRCVIPSDDLEFDDTIISAENVSGGGMLIKSGGNLKMDEAVSVEIKVPGYLKTIFAKCKVCWTEYLKDKSQGLLAGVQFINIGSYDRQMILDYIHFAD